MTETTKEEPKRRSRKAVDPVELWRKEREAQKEARDKARQRATRNNVNARKINTRVGRRQK